MNMNQSKIWRWELGCMLLFVTFTVVAEDKPVSPPTVPQWIFLPTSIPTSSDKTEQNKTLPGSSLKFSEAQLLDRSTAVDWFPKLHPAMPASVKGGRGPVFACGFCHLPTGDGRPENAALAGLPYEYLRQQLRDMKSGARVIVDPKFIPGGNMMITIKQTTDADDDEAAKYFAGLKYTKRLKVIETKEIPHVTANGFVYVFDKTGPREPLGERIVEGPNDFDQFEKRDPRTPYTAYVPIGSIKRGAKLVNGNNGTKPACASCHGVGLKGGPLGPPIAGRYPSSLFRQLYAFQINTRNGSQAALMKPNVLGMSQSDMIDIAAYVGSLTP